MDAKTITKTVPWTMVFFMARDFAYAHRARSTVETFDNVLSEGSVILCVGRPVCILSLLSLRPRALQYLKHILQGKIIIPYKRMTYFYTPFLLIHDQLVLGSPFFEWINAKLLRFQLKKIMHIFSRKENELISWHYKPHLSYCMGLVDEKVIIYDCYDEYCAEELYQGKQKKLALLRQKEEELLSKATLCFAASHALAERRKSCKNLYVIPNGVEESFLVGMTHKADPLSGIVRPIIGYVGSISSFLDYALLYTLAQKRPLWSFVFIGDMKGEDRRRVKMQTAPLARCANVFFLGRIPYEKLPCYLQSFDVGILPYTKTLFNFARSPLKGYEYFAFGKPVVATGVDPRSMPEGVRFADDTESFMRAIESSVQENDQAAALARIAIAHNATWTRRVHMMKKYILHALVEKNGQGKALDQN